MPNWRPLTDEEILAQLPAARERGERAARHEPRAASAEYHAESGWTIVRLVAGGILAFPPVDEMRELTSEQLARVRVHPGGRGLYWEGTDAVLSIPGMLGGEYFGD
jgi:hypothetical protein